MTAHTVEESGRGWAIFAGVMFIVASASNLLYGISALANDDYFAADELLFGDLAVWGVVALGFAAAQFGTALLILQRSALGALFGITLATLHAVAALASIGAYPLWTTVLLVVDGLIIYGLCVHGDRWE
jgi:hypothetical protein